MSSTGDLSETFPPLNPQRYQWKPITSGWERLALAGETQWVYRPRDYHQMFLRASLRLSVPFSALQFQVAAKNSWLRLRQDNPEMSLTTKSTDNGETYMQAHIFQSDSDALKWCSETFFSETAQKQAGFDILQERLLFLKAGQNPRPTALLINEVVNSNHNIEAVELMLNVEHQIADGIGIRILLSKYLSLLAKALSASEVSAEEGIDLHKSSKIPSVPWICLLNEDQIVAGPEYEKTVAWNRHILLEKLSQNPGLSLLPHGRPATQNHHFITLPKSHSTAIIAAVKSSLGSTANITHLGHAAMVVTLLRDANLQKLYPLPEDTVLYSACWINGRRYLQASSEQQPPTKSYVPICQTFAPIIFSDLSSLALPSNATTSEVKETLLKACRVATAQYAVIRQRKSIMPESVALMEHFGAEMRRAIAKGLPTHEEIRPQTADPYFLSDGITETYIERQYSDQFEVREIQFAAHAAVGTNLIVRMSSWRDQLTLSGEWRGCDYDEKYIVKFLEDIVDTMSFIVAED